MNALNNKLVMALIAAVVAGVAVYTGVVDVAAILALFGGSVPN